jgi:ppGpp synthetase/RelA/SpoT-type nucleotidyltranferase
MPPDDRITPAEHRRQIEAYLQERPVYVKYADVLQRVLKQSCAVACPAALVQSRAKTVSSFAEKCARKYPKYKDAVHQFTDLCGARVVVQTTAQVRAVCEFVESNFRIVDKEDKSRSLSKDRFGYRGTHYVVELRSDRGEALAIRDDERQEIGGARAELQVRTWLQHAWADALHDRIYKSDLQLSPETRRTEALLAALMEEGDRTFDAMTRELDDMIANYAAVAKRDEVEREIDIQTLILENEPEPRNRPAVALSLARLLAACGEDERVVEVLDPQREVNGAIRCELLQELGFAMCNMHRAAPQSEGYRRGRAFLEESLFLCRQTDARSVPDLPRRNAVHARSLSRLARVLEPLDADSDSARQYMREATELEPDNPYYLADLLRFELHGDQQTTVPEMMRTTIRHAVAKCRRHAEAGIELPHSYFTAGRLSLLLGQPYHALGYYARGVRHIGDGEHCTPRGAIEQEAQWVQRLHGDRPVPEGQQWVLDLLAMTTRLTPAPTGDSRCKALVVAGGAASADGHLLDETGPLLEAALAAFSGRVISGGTKAGVPGRVGRVARELDQKNSKHFELAGYIPKNLPGHTAEDDRYDRLVVCGENRFSAEQVLCVWSDLLEEGTRPSEVVVLGIGGGPISSVEYRLALAVGATVAVVIGTGGAADAILRDKLWSNLPNLFPLPNDAASVRALVASESTQFSAGDLEKMGQVFHQQYVSMSGHRLPANMRSWADLPETYRRANIDQARHAVRILAACGFGVRPSPCPVLFAEFEEREMEEMAQLEHGRWNVDRLRDGWRPGPRDDELRLHDGIVRWTDLREDVKEYDRLAVRNFPNLLAQAGWEVFRR